MTLRGVKLSFFAFAMLQFLCVVFVDSVYFTFFFFIDQQITFFFNIYTKPLYIHMYKYKCLCLP